MATITKTQSGTWKAQVRKIGLPAVSKTFNTKHDAEVWSRSVESEQDRGVYVNRSEADRVSCSCLEYSSLVIGYACYQAALSLEGFLDKLHLRHPIFSGFWSLDFTRACHVCTQNGHLHHTF